MADRFGYEIGICLICGKDKPVRWKNLYLIGSEGTNMCIDCELDLLKYLSEKKIEFVRLKIKKRRMEGDNNGKI